LHLSQRVGFPSGNLKTRTGPKAFGARVVGLCNGPGNTKPKGEREAAVRLHAGAANRQHGETPRRVKGG